MRVYRQAWGDGDYQIHDHRDKVVIVPRDEMADLGRLLMKRAGLVVTDTKSVEPC